MEKIKESHIRQIQISEKSLDGLDKMQEELLAINSHTEQTILNKIG